MRIEADNRALWRHALLLCALLGALGLGHGLWTPDEPREAEISREMALAPTVIPTLNGHAFIEKPPLYYWVVAGVFRGLGHPSADAARAVSALAGALAAGRRVTTGRPSKRLTVPCLSLPAPAPARRAC